MNTVINTLAEFKTALTLLGSALRIGYVRVSTDLKHQDSSVDRQIFTYTQKEVSLIVIERETGTTDESRPLYQELIRLVSIGMVQEIITARSDRLNRNANEMRYFYDLCTEVGTSWTFLDEPELSSNSPWAIELRSQKAYEAQQESERLGRRQERAYAYAEQTHKAVARKNTFGYRINKLRIYEVDNVYPDYSNAVGVLNNIPVATGELARYLIENFLEHKTLRQALKHWKQNIVKNLNTSMIGDPKIKEKCLKLSSAFMCDWIRNPVLRGHIAYGKYKKIRYGDKLEKKRYQSKPEHEWRIEWNTHPSETIISASEYEVIKKTLESNTGLGYAIAKQKLNPNEPVSLACILRCQHCKLRYLATSSLKKGKRYRYYYCQGRKDFHCTNKGITEYQLITQMVEFITNKADSLSNALQDTSSGLINTNKSNLELLINESEEAYKKYQITGLKEYLNTHLQFKLKVSEILANREQEVKKVTENLELLRSLSSIEFWRALSPYELNYYLKEIVRDCWIDHKIVVQVDLAL